MSGPSYRRRQGGITFLFSVGMCREERSDLVNHSRGDRLVIEMLLFSATMYCLYIRCAYVYSHQCLNTFVWVWSSVWGSWFNNMNSWFFLSGNLPNKTCGRRYLVNNIEFVLALKISVPLTVYRIHTRRTHFIMWSRSKSWKFCVVFIITEYRILLQ